MPWSIHCHVPRIEANINDRCAAFLLLSRWSKLQVDLLHTGIVRFRGILVVLLDLEALYGKENMASAKSGGNSGMGGLSSLATKIGWKVS